MAATIASTINSVKAVGTALSVGQHIIDTSVGVIAGFLGALHGIDSLALPNGGAAYDHPGATR